jgi:4-amino-4-deoxy-L-arabinose transferase-like glycosyltransferase
VPRGLTATAPQPRHGAPRAQPASRRGRLSKLRSPKLLFAVVTAVAAALAGVANFVHLATLPQLSDEPIYQHAAWRYLHGLNVPLVKLKSGQWRIPYPDNYEHPPLSKYLFGVAQVIVGRESVAADRAVAATCTVLTGVVVAWWLARTVNRWVGLLAGTLIALLPQHGLVPDSIGRHGMLEPVAALFMTASLVLAWLWFSTGSFRRSWVYAIATGLAAGLATSAKEIAFLAVLGPVIVGLVVAARSGRDVVIRGIQAAAAALVAVGTFLALYVPIGPPATLIDYMSYTQHRHQTCGHPIQVASQIYRFPPWWATFWFTYHGLGAAVTIALAVLGLGAVVLRRDRLVVWLLAGLAGPLIFLCFFFDVALPYYWTLLTAPFFALAAVGVGELAVRARALTPRRAWAPAVAVLAALCIFGVAFGQMISSVVTLRPSGVKMVRSVTQQLGLNGKGVVVGVPVVTLREYVPQQRLIRALPKALTDIDWMVAAPNIGRTPVDPGVRALLAVNQRGHNVTAVYSDSELTLYRVTRPLVRPSRAEINAQPPTMPACPS